MTDRLEVCPGDMLFLVSSQENLVRKIVSGVF